MNVQHTEIDRRLYQVKSSHFVVFMAFNINFDQKPVCYIYLNVKQF